MIVEGELSMQINWTTNRPMFLHHFEPSKKGNPTSGQVANSIAIA
jgi:hypothetical protein